MSEQPPQEGEETAPLHPAEAPLPTGPLLAINPVPAEDKHFAQAALKKMQAGQSPTGRESDALKRVRKFEEESRTWQIVRAIPLKIWDAMTGKPRSRRIELAKVYGLPLADVEAIDLAAFLRALETLLVQNAFAIRDAKRDGGTLNSQVKEIDLRLKKLELAKREGELVEVARVERMFMMIQQSERRMIEYVIQKYGREAAQPMTEEVELQSRQWADEFGAKS